MRQESLSLVVASQDAETTIVQCLRAFLEDAAEARVGLEIVVADASSDRSAALAAEAAPQARILRLPRRSLVPELWSAGIRAARSEYVALASAHCVPQPGWTRAILEGFADGVAGVGGAIECAAGASYVDRAIYFSRYAAWAPPFPAGEADDLAADNACYRASVLRRFPRYVEGPFWEHFLHRELRRAGWRLRKEPGAAVTYVRSYGAARFLGLRFRHGRHFGKLRAADEPASLGLARAAAAPLVPWVLWLRAAQRSGQLGSRRRGFFSVSPLVLAFVSAFAAGEAVGTLEAIRVRGVARSVRSNRA
jgi:glycosyltransferase involved in cell wall biosynthesis